MKKNVKVQLESENEKKACEYIIKTAVKNNVKAARDLLVLKKNACEKYKIGFVSNPLLLNIYRQLIVDKKIKSSDALFQILRKRRIRTSSGIASVAVLTKPYPCPGKCIYCPTQEGSPKSYIDNEPAVMRAVLAKYDPVKQIQIRLRGFEIAGNPADKIELIVMGGTWSYLPIIYQLKFIIGCFWATNTFNSKLQISNNKLQTHSINSGQVKSKFQFNKLSNNIKELKNILKKEHRKNERAKYRIIGLTLETRPDFIDEKEIKFMRELGCTRVEMGVQSIFDDILIKNSRGHLVNKTIKATKLLKDAGFKICYHMMPNLYASNYKKDVKMFKELFANQDFQPDMIKIYPCVVTKYAKLEKLYKQKKYIPYADNELIKLLIEIKKDLPEYVRVQRCIRDIPKENIIGGSTISNLRQILQARGAKCDCIRCREIREDKKINVKLKRIDYDASGGKEVFLQYVDKDNKLYALLRLRITSQILSAKFKNQNAKRKINESLCDDYNHWILELNGCAIIREVHTYGPMLEVGTKSNKDPQHSGLGKKLIGEAERITKQEFGISKIAVISGVGVREYYRKIGYKLNNLYMIKKI
jgi:elongator complex protein 3